MRFLSTLILLLSFAVLPACGGGGSGGAPAIPAPTFTNADVVGDYMFVMAQGAVPRTLTSNFLRATSNGAGTLTLVGGNNTDGVVGATPATPLQYNVAADGTLTLFSGVNPVAKGGLSADGKRAVLAINAAIDPGIIIMIRTEGSYSQASLTGNYVAGEFGMAVGSPNVFQAALAPDAFDGMGGYNGLGFVNREGAVTSFNLMGPDSGYLVGGTGALTLQPTFGDPLEGQIAANGAYALVAGATQSLNNQSPPLARLMIKSGTSMGLGNLSGSYYAVSLEFNVGSPLLEAFTGTMDVTSSGAVALGGEVNSGAGAVAHSVSGAASIGSDGALTMNRSGGNEALRGQLSQDGQIGFVVGGESSGSNPTLLVFIRK